jgi:hypothetical protein
MKVFGVFYNPGSGEKLLPPLYATRGLAEMALVLWCGSESDDVYRFGGESFEAYQNRRYEFFQINVQELEVVSA